MKIRFALLLLSLATIGGGALFHILPSSPYILCCAAAIAMLQSFSTSPLQQRALGVVLGLLAYVYISKGVPMLYAAPFAFLGAWYFASPEKPVVEFELM